MFHCRALHSGIAFHGYLCVALHHVMLDYTTLHYNLQQYMALHRYILRHDITLHPFGIPGGSHIQHQRGTVARHDIVGPDIGTALVRQGPPHLDAEQLS